MAINLISTLASPTSAAPPSADTIDLRRKYAAALLANKPVVAAPSQGIEALLEGLVGGRMLKRADRDDAAANAEAGKASAAMIQALMGPSAPASPGSPAVPAGGNTGWMPGPGKPAAPPTPATGAYALTPDAVGSFIANPRIDSGLKSALLGKMLTKPETGFTGTLSPGELAFKNGAVVAKGGPKTAEPLALEKYADMLGLKPGTPEFTDFITKHAGGGATVNVGANSIESLFAKRYDQITTDGTVAQEALAKLDKLEELTKDPNFYSGAGSGPVLFLKQGIAALGGNPDAAKPMEEFQALSKKFALDSLGGSLGTGISNADRSFITDTVTSEDATPAGNVGRIKVNRALQQRKMEIAELADDYVLKNGNLDAGWNKAVREYGETHPMFPKAVEITTPKGGGKAKFKVNPDGSREYIP